MRAQLHTLHGSAEGLIPALMRAPQKQEALDDLLRPASSLPGPSRVLHLLHPARIDWEAVAAASFIYVLAFAVWLYLAK